MSARRIPFAESLLAAGIFAAGLAAYYARSRPALAGIPPQDAEWQRQLSVSPGATAEAVAALEARLATARARLPAAGIFDGEMQRWCRNWIVETRSLEPFPDGEERHYSLAYDHPKMTSWPDILETIKILCAEPGLNIDDLALAVAPDASEEFRQVEISFTVRLRR